MVVKDKFPLGWMLRPEMLASDKTWGWSKKAWERFAWDKREYGADRGTNGRDSWHGKKESTIRNWTTLLVVNCYMRHYFHYSRMVLTITILVLAILLYVTMKVCLFTSLTTMVFLCITGCWLPILFAIAFAPICYVKSDLGLVLLLLCVTIH